MVEIHGFNAPEAYAESLYKMRIFGIKEQSRNGEVITIPEPVMLSIADPRMRLITDPVRDVNPFFHCMEFIWMMAGSDDAIWLSQFNKNYINYSDDGKHVHAGYGHRWRKNFGCDQIALIVEGLKKNPEDRRLLLQMWDTETDLARTGKDFPCNTQAMFRVIEGRLNMLVTNRSNDLIWGMLGANVVHMTMLQELIALAAGLKVGTYRVISNNLHVYTGMPRFQEIWKSLPSEDIYATEAPEILPLLQEGETLQDFLRDCEMLVAARGNRFKTKWMIKVGIHMYDIWFLRKDGEHIFPEDIGSADWRLACLKWLGSTYRG